MRKFFFILVSCTTLLHAQVTEFFRTYSSGLYDVGETVINLADTSYVVAGTTNVTGMNGTDLLIFKTNSAGDVTWWKNIGGPGIQSGKGAVKALDNSGFYVAGYKNNFDSTGYDIWVVKTDGNGSVQWTKAYGGNDWEMAHSINTLSDSTYIIAGETYSYGHGQRDVYLIRMNPAGDTLWTKTYGGTGNDIAQYVFVDATDHLLVIGSTESFGAGQSDAYVLYLDINGDTLWTRTIGTANDDFGYSADIYTDTNTLQNSFVIGYTSYYAPDSAQNSYVLKIDTATGSSIALYPQMESNPEILDHIKIHQGDPGMHYFSADIKYGYDEIAIIYAFRSVFGLGSGAQNTYGSGGNESTLPNDIHRTLDRGYIMTGYSENWGPGPTSCFLLKTDSVLTGPNVPIVGLEKLEKTAIAVFPNPVLGEYFYINAGDHIQAANIYNLSGELISSSTWFQGVQSVTLARPQVPAGIYVAEIITQEQTARVKLVFQ